MTNVRALLYRLGIGDALSYRVSWILWLLGTALLLWLCRSSRQSSWIVVIVALVLFGPHVNETEDLHLLVAALAASAQVEKSEGELAQLWPYAFWLVLLLGSLHVALPPVVGVALASAGKMALLIGAIYLAPSKPVSRPEG